MKYGTMTYLISKGKVLMIKKNLRKDDPNSGYFTLPGGKLESFEKGLSIPLGRINSSIREVKEETGSLEKSFGIKVLDAKLQGVILFDNTEREFNDWKNPDNFLVYIYSANKFRGKAVESSEGIPYFISLDKIFELSSNAGDKLMYSWILTGRNFFGVIYHKKKEIDEDKSFVDFFY